MLAGDTNGQVAAWAGLSFLWAVALTGSAAAMSGRRVRLLPVELLAGVSTLSQPRRRAIIFLILGLAPQLWLAAFIASPPEGMTENGHVIVPAELVVLAAWLVYLVRAPRLPVLSLDLSLPDQPAASSERGEGQTCAAKSGGGIVWAAVGAFLICLTLYAAFATPALYGTESETGRFLVYGVGGGIVLILVGANRGIALPNGWTVPSSARVGGLVATAVIVIGLAATYGGTDWAVLVGLLAFLLLPFAWRALARKRA